MIFVSMLALFLSALLSSSSPLLNGDCAVRSITSLSCRCFFFLSFAWLSVCVPILFRSKFSSKCRVREQIINFAVFNTQYMDTYTHNVRNIDRVQCDRWASIDSVGSRHCISWHVRYATCRLVKSRYIAYIRRMLDVEVGAHVCECVRANGWKSRTRDAHRSTEWGENEMARWLHERTERE